MATVEERAESGGSGVSDEMLRGFFREMLLIRRFEEKVEERFRAGELPGFLHVAIGQEATATGVCAALEREVIVAGNYDHLQLWSPVAWEQHLHAVEGSAEHAAERLAARGL